MSYQGLPTEADARSGRVAPLPHLLRLRKGRGGGRGDASQTRNHRLVCAGTWSNSASTSSSEDAERPILVGMTADDLIRPIHLGEVLTGDFIEGIGITQSKLA